MVDLITTLGTRCELLAKALRDNDVPRDKRKAVRELLHRAFRLQSETQVLPAELESTLDAVDLALHESGWAPWEVVPSLADDLIARMEKMNPVKIRSAVRSGLLARHRRTWSRLGHRLQSIVDWFWARCEPKEESKPVDAAQAKAAEEFGAEDMEYVWGRRRRW